MTDHDPRVAAALNRLTPPVQDVRDEWERVIADARLADARRSPHTPRVTSSKRRLALITALVSVGLLIPVLAVGASRGWWFQSHIRQPWSADWPQPLSGAPAILATGHAQGSAWTGVAFISKRLFGPRVEPRRRSGVSICFAMIVGSRSNPPQSSGCGQLYGMNATSIGGWAAIANWSFPKPPVIAGAVAKGVARVKIILNPYPYYTGKAHTITAQLMSAPQVGGGIHFFTAPYNPNVGINSIVLLDKNGKILTRLRSG
jgi:hypothetical protein